MRDVRMPNRMYSGRRLFRPYARHSPGLMGGDADGDFDIIELVLHVDRFDGTDPTVPHSLRLHGLHNKEGSDEDLGQRVIERGG